ncbi:MAG: hypothetical protein E7240_02950 [Lachnospiraceae bacterium]|nr:hypothetical protein [Lachnospiraceae bacterium]
MTRIDMYGGLLGVGKTTVIRQLLQNGYGAYRVVIIENEIGKVNLDAAYLKETGVTVREMTNGCICCSIRGQLGEAIREMVQSFCPDFIIMEPSGAADIRGIREEIEKIPEVRAGRSVLIINAKKAMTLLQVVGPFFYDQIRCSNLIYLNRADQIPEEQLQEVRETLCGINPDVRFVEKPVEALSLDDFPVSEVSDQPDLSELSSLSDLPNLPDSGFEQAGDSGVKIPVLSPEVNRQSSFSIRDLDAPKKLEFSKSKKEDVLYTWHWRLPEALTEEQYAAVLAALRDTDHLALWRAKGFVKTLDGVQHKIDYVFGDLFSEEFKGEVPETESGIVLIGRKIDRRFLGEVLSSAENGKTGTSGD